MIPLHNVNVYNPYTGDDKAAITLASYWSAASQMWSADRNSTTATSRGLPLPILNDMIWWLGWFLDPNLIPAIPC